MKKLAAILALAAWTTFAPAAPAQTPQVQPRIVADHMAQQIADNYFSPSRGAEIAAHLRERALAGAFDRFTNPRDLAAQLAITLQPYDNHFQVQWNADDGATRGPIAGPPPDAARFQRSLGRSNYGFVSVDMLPGGIGYIDLRGFAHFTEQDAATAPARRAADAAIAGVSGAGAIIIDLRDSSGGSPAMVGYLASYFVPQGDNIYNTFHSREGDRSEAPFVEPTLPRLLDPPLYILTSGRTASASESFAYTLQNAGRATVIGAPSAGGANPGGFVPVGDGFAVFISEATPESPITHTNWEGTGVQPSTITTSEEALATARVLALQAIAARSPYEDARTEARWALSQFNTRDAVTRNPRQYAGNYGQRSIAVEDGRLVLHRDRRPGLALTQIEPDLFAVQNVLPLQQVHFERDARGRIVAFELRSVNGDVFRNTRE